MDIRIRAKKSYIIYGHNQKSDDATAKNRAKNLRKAKR